MFSDLKRCVCVAHLWVSWKTSTRTCAEVRRVPGVYCFVSPLGQGPHAGAEVGALAQLSGCELLGSTCLSDFGEADMPSCAQLFE